MSRKAQHKARKKKQRERAASHEARHLNWTYEGQDCSARWSNLTTRGGLALSFVPMPGFPAFQASSPEELSAALAESVTTVGHA
jgi:hypothetical protein